MCCAIALAGCLKADASNSIVPENQNNASEIAIFSSERHELGRKVYNFRCYYCHGYSGNARTLAATSLDPKPLDFTATLPDGLNRERMMQSVRLGRKGTAMMAFEGVLSDEEVAAVVDFVRHEFMVNKAENTRYHTAENGWPDHERYRLAYPFALGEIALDTAWEQLTPKQVAGKQMFLTSCISCHDRAHVVDDELVWQPRTVSYPRNHFVPGDDLKEVNQREPIDGMASASPYAIHDRMPQLADLSAIERKGEALFQKNCAFCHAADGTGRNWIGSFLEPHPRNFTDAAEMHGLTRPQVKQVIRDGLPGTSMSAWKSVLAEEEIDALVSYIGRAFYTFPAESDSTGQN